MLLTGKEAAQYIEHKPEDIQPSSIDVHLGRGFLTEHFGDDLMNDNSSLYLLKPKEFVLCVLKEKITLPNNVSAQFFLKSSAARKGIDHAAACWIDAGYTGNITLELRNNWEYTSIELKVGMPIGQIVFHKHNETTPYNGRYQGDTTVSGAK